MTSQEGWYAAARAHLWMPYTQMKSAPPPLAVVATRGSRIVLADGRELIDGVASWWTCAHGYNHPAIAQAVRAQLARMPHVMLGGLVHEQAARLAARLAALLPGDLERVFFSESGSVSVEIAMKIALGFWHNRGEPMRRRFVAFRGGYHGDTFATMAITDPELAGSPSGLTLEQLIADLPSDEEASARLDALLAREGPTIAALVIEPLVQGAGGMRMHTPATLRRVRELADRHDLLLIADEIFTGFGRTGTLFACEQAGIVPDLVTLSKALTGGTLPLAATVARRHVFEAFWSDQTSQALLHGPTYMGNPLACAAANASLDLFASEPRLQQVTRLADGLRALEACRDLPGVRDVRVLGAIGVVELDRMPELWPLRMRFVEAGVWVRPFRDVVALTPPLTIPPEELATLTDAVVAVLGRGFA